jgi:hypothetical protein
MTIPTYLSQKLHPQDTNNRPEPNARSEGSVSLDGEVNPHLGNPVR